MPLSKADPKMPYGGLPNPTTHFQHSTRRLPSRSSGSSELLLRGSSLRNLLHQSSSVYSQRSPAAATQRSDGTCSAYSSPRIPKREASRSKDTLDIHTGALRDLQIRRNTNKNWTFGKYRQRNVDNAHSADEAAFSRKHHAKRGNRNVESLEGVGSFQGDVRSISDQGRSTSKTKLPGRVNMAAVAPFRYRCQDQEEPRGTLEDLSDCSSDSMEVCCDDLAGLLGSSVKGREGDFKMDSSKAYSQADGKGLGFGAKRPKSGGPQSTQRGELKVYRAGSAEGRLPVASSLRKQRSMTNLAVLTDAEKKLHLYEPKWCDDMAKPGVAGLRKTGKPTGKVPGGGAPLSRNLSKSEHSLFQGKHKPFAPLAAAPGKQSRIPRAPYAEVKPLSKAPEDGRSDDEILSSKAKAAPKKTGAGGDSGSKGQEEEGADKPFLKVDPELVVTVLGDLEQLLFSQMLDPESQRKRTVQNVLDLRQNLEDTMLSLRGSQQSHSCADSSNVGYDSDDTNARSMSSLSNRSSPLSWRHGQASPRLQAGDAPSSAAGGYQGSKTLTQYVAQTMPARCSGRLSGTSRVDLLDDGDLKSGCLSDSDLLGKNLPDDDDNLTNGWDESSSISSGLSDGDGEVSDNLSSEEFNASSSLNSLPNTPLGSRRNSSIMLRTDAEKRSLVESGLSWYSEDGKAGRKLDACGYDTGSLKTEAPSKWRKKPPSLSDELSVKEEARKPQRLAASGSFKKSRNPPVGVTSPITHTSQSMLKLAAPKNDKPQDKSKISIKTAGLQRSRSDAGRDHHVDTRKPPSGLVIQYRSLPRPAKSSTLSVIGRPASRPVSGTLDASLLTLKPVSMASASPRVKEPTSLSSKMSNRTMVVPVNQTDREKEKARAKAVCADMDVDCSSLKGDEVPSESSRESMLKLHSLRRTSSSKYPELSSPTTPRMLVKSLGRPPSLAHLDKVNSNSLDSCVTIQDLPPKVPPYSKLQDLASSHSTTRLTPSPAPVLHIDSSGSYTSDSLGGSPLLYPKLSTMHRSMESLPLQMSVPSRARFSPKESQGSERGVGTWGAGSRTSLNLSEGLQTDRNTLPKKGLERCSSSLSESDGMKPGRRHSHNATSERNSPPQLPSPTRTIHLLSATKAPLTNVVAPISSSGTPRISRSNSIGPPGDCELYGSSPLGSTVSLAERPKSMMRSGSFRETADDVHGSVLSLASTASSNYSSSNEDRIQGEQIRKLRRELESSQEKVADLTMQLSANLGQANLVAAFEQSLALMTARLQTLSASSEQKDSELNDLRDTIEILKTKNTEAHDIIQGALNNSEIVSKELQINRQNSSESLSSLTSTASHTSMGSLKEQEAKKKKKKSWVYELRSSFNKAFSKKGAKPTGPYADIEEIATPESSVPPSPKVNRVGADPPPSSMKASASASSSGLCEGSEVADDKVVSDLRSELWEKERKLTDIRLEALTSAHQLEQLQETMTNMQKTVDNLKVENDQLKTSGLSPCPSPGPSSSVSQSSGLTSLASLSPRHSVAVRDARRTSTDSMDYASLSSQRDDHRVRVVVCVADLLVFKDEVKQQDFFLGTVRVNGRMDWPMLDSAVSQAFKVYVAKVDPTSSLGLSTDSIYSYSMGHIKRVLGGEAPETQPSRCMSRGPTSITVALKGLKEKCVDSLVFETLIPKPMMQHYISLLLKHRRLILSGPSGTGKTYLASRLAEYLVDRSAREVSDGIVVTFNMHRQSCKDLQLYLSNLANQIDRESSSSENPLVIIVDDIHDPASVSELINGALTCKYHKCPYIIGTSNQPVKMTANHSLHLSFRMVTFSNNVEPANGFLVRYLHRKLMESEDERNLTNEDLVRVLDWVPKLWYHLHTFLEKHSTSDFLIGPCFFLSCPVTVEEFRSWFIDLWNHSIIPYLQEGAKDGIKFHGQKAVWEDPVEWVRGTLPWPSAQQDQAKLFHLPPPSIGSSSPGQAGEEKSRKETTPSSTESDPLMAMLLKLQEAANYIESPDKDDPSLPRL
ncbi:LOW QUALITY PROTEIN: neuron navigator 1-like [Hippocampus comes]|uniref:LOW QUALITY PROTEIN: neuron navigator 1-like n=1 Tax=Hippocampus comes TaxID=109280 RepID=UPI00094EAB9C|nr:PREDICTED: LOW QUALITY PROTEIN: neuron navigator 1-like [Hippocampus comes]